MHLLVAILVLMLRFPGVCPAQVHHYLNGAIVFAPEIDKKNSEPRPGMDKEQLAAERFRSWDRAGIVEIAKSRPVLEVFEKSARFRVAIGNRRFSDWVDPANVTAEHQYSGTAELQKILSSLPQNTVIVCECYNDIGVDLSRFDSVFVNISGDMFPGKTLKGRLNKIFTVAEVQPNVFVPIKDRNGMRAGILLRDYRTGGASFTAGRDISVISFADDGDTLQQLRKLPGKAYAPPPVDSEASLRKAFQHSPTRLVLVLGHNEQGIFRPANGSSHFAIPITRVAEIARECCKTAVFPLSCDSIRATGTSGVAASFDSASVVARLNAALTNQNRNVLQFFARLASPDTPIVITAEITDKQSRLNGYMYRYRRLTRSFVELRQRLATLTLTWTDV